MAKAIRLYGIPAYVVKQQDEAVLRDIFDRMNNYGKRLTRAEVFFALHGGEGEARPRTFSDIVEHINVAHGFGEIDEDTVLRALLGQARFGRHARYSRGVRQRAGLARVSWGNFR